MRTKLMAGIDRKLKTERDEATLQRFKRQSASSVIRCRLIGAGIGGLICANCLRTRGCACCSSQHYRSALLQHVQAQGLHV